MKAGLVRQKREASRSKKAARVQRLYEVRQLGRQKTALRTRSFRWLPQLDLVALRIVDPSKSTVGRIIPLRINSDTRVLELFHKGVEVAYAKVQHELLLRTGKIIRVLLEGREHGASGFLLPKAATGSMRDPEVFFVPGSECLWVFGTKEQTADSENVLTHAGHPSLLQGQGKGVLSVRVGLQSPA